MGQRSEQRIAVSFEVVVRGIDPQGSPFETSAKTHDISCSGACLHGLSSLVATGSKIEIQCKDQLAWYRVQWVDKSADGARLTGVRCLEPGKYIWGVSPKGWAPDTYDPSHAEMVPSAPAEETSAYSGPASWSGADRRQFPRAACRIETQVTTGQGTVRLRGTVTDISLGGCYLEMLAPLPVDTVVELQLKPGNTTLQTTGKVRSSQTGLGMGIAFTKMTSADFEKLQQYAPALPKPAVVQKQGDVKRPSDRVPDMLVEATPSPAQPKPVSGRASEMSESPLPATPEAFQALLRVLFRKGLLTRAELVEELEKSKLTRAS